MTTSVLEVCDNFSRLKEHKSILRVGQRTKKDVDLSICIPTFKRPELLREAIESCLKQKENRLNVEILIVDNNPQLDNGNRKIVEDFANPLLCYYQNEQNLGIFGNWNRCIELSKGKWIALLHDDDLLAGDCFSMWEKMINSNVLEGVGYFKPCALSFNEKIENLNLNNIKYKLKKSFQNHVITLGKFDFIVNGNPGIFGMPTAGVLINRQAIMAVGGYSDDFFPSDDAFIVTRLYANGYRILFTFCPYGYYRYSVNECLKKEIHVGWIKCMISYRQVAQKFGGLYSKYGEFFKEEQLMQFYSDCLKMYDNKLKKEEFEEEISKVYNLKESKIKMALLHGISLIHYYNYYIRNFFGRRVN